MAMPCHFGLIIITEFIKKSSFLLEKSKSGAKLCKMDAKSASSKIAKKVQAGIAACLLPVFFIYVLLDKPDYKIVDALAGVVVPAARTVGDGITWPLRLFGKLGENMRERTGIRRENRELRTKLDALIAAQTECSVLAAENQRLERALDIVRAQPVRTVTARVIYENSSFSSHRWILDKGENAGIRAGQAVVSKDGFLSGVVIDAGADYARVRGISDIGANTPVRVAGSDVLGFLRGRGSASPVFELFSDQEFTPTPGVMLVSSASAGSLPDGIPVGKIKNLLGDNSAAVAPGAKTMSDAMVLIY
jgi:rod shape-determining protein MreC